MTRSRRALEALVSGGIVYALMAACSGSGKMSLSGGTTSGSGGHTGSGGVAHGSGGVMASGGHGGTMGSGGDSGIIDALMDPVPEAMAGIENPQSGTRLKGKFTMGSDGSKQYQLAVNEVDLVDAPPFVNINYHGRGVQAVWYDSMLMADCVFYGAEDGKSRCLPGHFYPPGVQYGLYFTDNQCTQAVLPLVSTGFGCMPVTPPQYMLYSVPQPAGACPASTPTPTPTRVYQIGSMTPTPAQLYTVQMTGMGLACNPVGPPQQTVWYTATQVSPSTFVQGTTGIDP